MTERKDQIVQTRVAHAALALLFVVVVMVVINESGRDRPDAARLMMDDGEQVRPAEPIRTPARVPTRARLTDQEMLDRLENGKARNEQEIIEALIQLREHPAYERGRRKQLEEMEDW